MADRWWTTGTVRAVTLYPWATMPVDDVVEALVDADVSAVVLIVKDSDGRVFYDSEVAPPQVPDRDVLGEFVEAADDRGLRVVANLNLLHDKFLGERHEEAVQVSSDDTRVRYPNVGAEWMCCICPTHEFVREHLQSIVDEVVRYDVDGVLLKNFDFQPIRRDGTGHPSCFCAKCRRTMGDRGVTPQTEGWIDARCDVVEQLIETVTEPARADGLPTMYMVDSLDQFDTSPRYLRRTFGIDLNWLGKQADLLVPNTAHVDLGLHPLWIRDTVRWLREYAGTPVLPVIKATKTGDPDVRVENNELFLAIQMALHGGAVGVNLFSVGANLGTIDRDQWHVVERSFGELGEQNHTP